MKKYVVFAGLMIVSTVIFAQQKTDADGRSGRYAEKIKKELALTDEQYNSVKIINKDFGGKVAALRQDSTLSKTARQEKIKSLSSERESALKKVMSEQQYTRWNELRSERTKKFRGRRSHSSADHASRMQKNLSLSDEQTSKIKMIDQEFAAKFQSLKSDTAIAKDTSKKLAGQLREEYRAKTKTVLTDDQLQKWESHLGASGRGKRKRS